jgi:hypothetical protein
MTRTPTPDETPTPPEATDDVEGHALPVVIGVSEMGRAPRPARRPAPEPLPHLTKTFPSLRDDAKRG